MTAATDTRRPRTIEVDGLTKTFGRVTAVDGLTFTVHPGRVTGFLGPNGAGKTTTLRMLLGLVVPDSGQATIDGMRYAAIPRPARVVGAALEAASFHPGRTAVDHLRVYTPQVGVPDSRCAEVLELTGLSAAATRRVGGFSLGMRQRLALATTLLGDPDVLLLDEPANGLDPEGIAWLRSLLRHLAGQGRTVLVSSHVLSEVQQTVDDVVIIAAGRLVHASSLAELAAMVDTATTVASPDGAGLAAMVEANGWAGRTTFTSPTTALIRDLPAAVVGAAAFAGGLELHELSQGGTSLESVFLRLTDPAGQPGPSQGGGAR